MTIFRDERIWRYLTNFWTVVLMAFLIVNFIKQGNYDYLTPSFSIIYTGVLSLYVGTKEFDRWYEVHDSRHPGEIFIAAWTLLIFFLFGAQLMFGGNYKVAPEVMADYIMVLSIFAVTQKSKKLHHRAKNAKKKTD